MIAKSEYAYVIKDFVVLLKKQTEGFSEEELANFLEMLNTSRDENMPAVYLGDEQKLMFRYMDGHIEVITTKKIQDILDYEKFKETGIITFREETPS